MKFILKGIVFIFAGILQCNIALSQRSFDLLQGGQIDLATIGKDYAAARVDNVKDNQGNILGSEIKVHCTRKGVSNDIVIRGMRNFFGGLWLWPAVSNDFNFTAKLLGKPELTPLHDNGELRISTLSRTGSFYCRGERIQTGTMTEKK